MSQAASQAGSSRSALKPILLVGLIVVLVLGVAYRIWVVPQARIYGDGFYRYDPIARNMLAGHGFSLAKEPPYKPDLAEVPGYPAFLAAVYAVSGGSSIAVVIAQLLLELGIWFLAFKTVLAMGLPRRAAIAVGVLGWLCPFLAAWCRETYADVPCAFAATLLLYLVVRACKGPLQNPILHYVGIGAAAALCAYIRVDTYPLLAFVALALVVAKAPEMAKPVARPVLIGTFLLTIAVVLAPWSIRHYSLTGELAVPGWRQYGLPNDPYLQWCETWVNDPEYVLPYMLHRGYPGKPPTYPPDRVPNDSERQRAEAAWQKWCSGSPYEGEVKATFAMLNDEANARMNLLDKLKIKGRRAAMVFAKYPSNTMMPAQLGGLGKIYLYGFWAMVLGLTACGLIRYRTQAIFLVPLGFIAARAIMPLASACGTEVRYQYPAFPCILLIAACGADWVIGKVTGKSGETGESPEVQS